MERYYKNRFCVCGCGGKIPIKPWHKNQGIPEYLQGHYWRGKERPDHSKKITGHEGHGKGKKRPDGNYNYGIDHYAWKGGAYTYYHTKARNLYLKDNCEICGATEEDSQLKNGCALHMHCADKNYKNLKEENWHTWCMQCHMKFHKIGTTYKHTEEAKRKMGLAHKGKKLTEEHKRKIGDANKRAWVKKKEANNVNSDKKN